MAMHDKSVMATGDDAAVSKLSATQLGYFDDPFIKLVPSPLPLPISGEKMRGVLSMVAEFGLATGTWCPSRRGALP